MCSQSTPIVASKRATESTNICEFGGLTLQQKQFLPEVIYGISRGFNPRKRSFRRFVFPLEKSASLTDYQRF